MLFSASYVNDYTTNFYKKTVAVDSHTSPLRIGSCVRLTEQNKFASTFGLRVIRAPNWLPFGTTGGTNAY